MVDEYHQRQNGQWESLTEKRSEEQSSAQSPDQSSPKPTIIPETTVDDSGLRELQAQIAQVEEAEQHEKT